MRGWAERVMSAGPITSAGCATTSRGCETATVRAGCRPRRASWRSRSRRFARLPSRSCLRCFRTRRSCCAPGRWRRWSSARSSAACRCETSSRCVRRRGWASSQSRPRHGSAPSCASALSSSGAATSTGSDWWRSSLTRSSSTSGPRARRRASFVPGALPRQGERVLVGVCLGMRESHEDWLALARDLIARGMPAPMLVVADGAPGLIKAVEQCWPASDRQHCRGVRARQCERGRRHAACRRSGPRVGLRAARGRRRCRTAPNQRHAGGAHQRGWGNASRVQTSSSLLDRGRRGRAGQWRDAARVVPRGGPQPQRRGHERAGTPVSTLTYVARREHPGLTRGGAKRVVDRLLGIPAVFSDIDLNADDGPFDGDSYLAAAKRAGSVAKLNRSLLGTAARARRRPICVDQGPRRDQDGQGRPQGLRPLDPDRRAGSRAANGFSAGCSTSGASRTSKTSAARRTRRRSSR